jgi:hypothetical protein
MTRTSTTRPIRRISVWRSARRPAAIAVLAFAALLPAQGQLVTGRLTTSFYTWEKYDSVDASTVYLRGFQTVQLSLAQENVSLHTYLSGAMMTGSDAFTTRFYNVYLRWARIARGLDLNIGRHAVYAGVGNGTIDGLSAKLHLMKDQITIVGYGGAAPTIGYRGVRTAFAQNLSLGGQIVTTLVPGARIGLSYLNRKEERDGYMALRARDTSFVPVPYYVTFEPEAEQLAGADVYYSVADVVSLYGRYDYDVTNVGTARIQGSARWEATNRLALTADYMHRLPRIRYNSIFSAFVRNAVDEIEGGAEYAVLPRARIFGRLASVTYEGENSMRWTAGVNTDLVALSYSGSDGYAGELQSVSLQGYYPLSEGRFTPSAGLSWVTYRITAEEEREAAWSGQLGATYRPVPTFSIDVQGQYLTNQTYANDLRLFLKFNYWFTGQLGLFAREVK